MFALRSNRARTETSTVETSCYVRTHWYSDRLWRFEGGAECPFFFCLSSLLALCPRPSSFRVWRRKNKNKNDVDISAISNSVYFWPLYRSTSLQFIWKYCGLLFLEHIFIALTFFKVMSLKSLPATTLKCFYSFKHYRSMVFSKINGILHDECHSGHVWRTKASK